MPTTVQGVSRGSMQHNSETYDFVIVGAGSAGCVARLARTGKRLGVLAKRVVRPSYSAVAAGRTAPEWLDPEVIGELEKGLRLLEDEWGAFS
jgi:choline dehydrogenase-like flavoprotein